MIMVSACLAGIACNYKGRATPDESVVQLVKQGLAYPVCPEILGGLTTPRCRARFVNGDGNSVLAGIKGAVITEDGADVTKPYLKGAELTLKLLRLLGTSTAILKQDSPSCGNGRVLSGSDVITRVAGDGITTALFKKEGIKVFSEEDLKDNTVIESLSLDSARSTKERVMISMCGLGIPCQYRARSFSRKSFIAGLISEYELCPVCPEQLGGLPTPRSACHIKGNIVLGRDGRDYTASYHLGAAAVRSCAVMIGIKKAYLKRGSPSCGVNGITRKCLESIGVRVYQL